YLADVNTADVLHSETNLARQVEELEKQFGKANVVVEQLYTERTPCPHCSQILQAVYPGASVFYSVELTAAQHRQFSGQVINGRADALHRMYLESTPRPPATAPPRSPGRRR